MPPKRGQESTLRLHSSTNPSKSTINPAPHPFVDLGARNLLNNSLSSDMESKRNIQNPQNAKAKPTTISPESLKKNDKTHQRSSDTSENILEAKTHRSPPKPQPQLRRIGIFSAHPNIHSGEHEHKSFFKTNHNGINKNTNQPGSLLREKYMATEFNEKVRHVLQYPQYFSEHSGRSQQPLFFERRTKNVPILSIHRRLSSVDNTDVFSMAEEDSKRSFLDSIASLVVALDKDREEKNGGETTKERRVTSPKVLATDLLQSIADENHLDKIKKLEKSIYKRKSYFTLQKREKIQT